MTPEPTPTRVDLSGLVAVVTGAAQGLGLAMASELAIDGARVVLADLQLAKAQAAADDLVAQGLEARSVELDVTDSAGGSGGVCGRGDRRGAARYRGQQCRGGATPGQDFGLV